MRREAFCNVKGQKDVLSKKEIQFLSIKKLILASYSQQSTGSQGIFLSDR